MNGVTDNRERKRFELTENGMTAFANYLPRGDNDLLITHVESPPALRGKGTASRLMEGVAAIARSQGTRLTPLCSYAALWFRRHPDEADLLG
ncbi:MAG: N-acetyltransferase [Alphaproteobacteria bacterium]|nr:N-acetyltransferase [Alphaproteobacteria bacterium]